jgi:hypothetical protein
VSIDTSTRKQQRQPSFATSGVQQDVSSADPELCLTCGYASARMPVLRPRTIIQISLCVGFSVYRFQGDLCRGTRYAFLKIDSKEHARLRRRPGVRRRIRRSKIAILGFFLLRLRKTTATTSRPCGPPARTVTSTRTSSIYILCTLGRFTVYLLMPPLSIMPSHSGSAFTLGLPLTHVQVHDATLISVGTWGCIGRVTELCHYSRNRRCGLRSYKPLYAIVVW